MIHIKKMLVVLLMLPFIAIAQQDPKTEKDTAWTISGNINLNFSQVSLTNWAAGGKSSMTGIFITNIAAKYKKDKVSWDNSIDFRYGFLKEEGNDLQKSDDNIDLNTKYGYQAKEKWFYSAYGNFKSQFAPGYNYPNTEDVISKFMAPAYINLGLGMDYKAKNLSLVLSPVTGKFTFVTDDVLAADGAFGVEPGKNTRSEMGAAIKLDYKTEVVKNVTFQTKLDLFSNYFHNPQNIDVDWNILINMKVNDFLSANLVTRLIYDDDVKILDNETGTSAPRVQFMEMFGVGLMFKF